MLGLRLRLVAFARRFDRDDRGISDNVGGILMIGIVVIPLIIMMTVFGKELIEAVQTWGTNVIQKGDDLEQATGNIDFAN